MSNATNWTVPAVIGHRGAAGHAPENTLASLEAAARLGVRWVEFDVKLTRDGACVLFHDDTVERTTNGRGAVAETTLDAMRALDAGAWFGPAFAGERVPTLMDAMAALARLGLGANMEIKPSPGRAVETGAAVARAIQESWPKSLPAPLVSSFDAEALGAARDQAPEFPRAFLTVRLGRRWRGAAKALDCVAVHCRGTELTAARARRVRDAGYGLRAFTVNDDALAQTLFGWGVDGVITDYPDRITPP